jgi:hypothetical protein
MGPQYTGTVMRPGLPFSAAPGNRRANPAAGTLCFEEELIEFLVEKKEIQIQICIRI